ncbi:serpentine type 7TM GPCR chemoreceptor srh domain-containing protein [Ditylenchus destructor]|uniref:Serpentine type 7TM GPCR chemoreceptor srh domain-containing protein n=1 Tax=Ditylenchus destructor TaxID=166010 RepID=A0AAD4QYL8_9BILA|nr:serpentine type 7TM GPCR chemoreceptor srh domain-containing protein [Ditylenchus destructor]
MLPISNESRHDIVLIPETFLLVGEYIALVIFGVLLCSYSLMVYVVLWKSPSSMTTYKWYILMNGTYAVLFELVFALASPEPLFPYPMLIVGGPLRNVHLGTTFNNIYLELGMLSIIFVFQSTLILFLYRYCQTADNYFYTRFLSDIRWTAAINFSIVVGGLIFMLVEQLVVKFFKSSEELKDWIRAVDPKVYSHIGDRQVVGFVREGTEPYWLFCGVLTLFFTFSIAGIVAFCTYGCHRHLRQKQSMLSSRTISLYRALINSLILDMSIAAVLVLIPYATVLFAFAYDSPYTAILSACTFGLASLYPVLTNIILMTFVTPYRKATIGLMKTFAGRITNRKFSVSSRTSIQTSSVYRRQKISESSTNISSLSVFANYERNERQKPRPVFNRSQSVGFALGTKFSTDPVS